MATIRCLNRTFTDIAAIIFDKDGTLANVESYLKSLGQKRSQLVDSQVPGVQEPLLLAFGVEETHLNPAGLLAVGSRHESKIAAAAYVAETGRNWLEAMEIVDSAFEEADSYLQRKADHTPLFADTLDTLTSLATAKIKIGILSADSSLNIQDFIKAYQLDHLVQSYVGVNGTVTKPDPSLFLEICAQLEVFPNQALMIGDSPVDLKMAKTAEAAGCLIVNWGWHTQKASTIGADAYLDSWQQLSVIP